MSRCKTLDPSLHTEKDRAAIQRKWVGLGGWNPKAVGVCAACDFPIDPPFQKGVITGQELGLCSTCAQSVFDSTIYAQRQEG